MEGWLTKQGHIWKTWNTRYCVVDGNELKYSKAQNSGPGPPVPPLELKGTVPLGGCTVETLAPSAAHGRQHAFRITPVTNKVFIFCAADKATCDAWVATLGVVLAMPRSNAANHSAAASSS